MAVPVVGPALPHRDRQTRRGRAGARARRRAGGFRPGAGRRRAPATASARLPARAPSRASRVVVLDLSGVPAVDAEMAAHLVGAARAVALLGARPLLVGIGPAVAQAIVAGGVDLGRFTTAGGLAGGLEQALAWLGKTIVDTR
ncbi:STAS domain-containing protein [Nannocystis radixulma]|uniref:STAS domain-containing protein n=1 Tax=Nannocystis radixulma TaxID=2995305 RepID=A0ABT5B0R0_9BACT|nr:STAS domain-containing protein [Nannocystis radixulma]MDC0667685.1 STAS domain-containing protein [Nannocystis radixulma]